MQFSDHGVLDEEAQQAWLRKAATAKNQCELPGLLATEHKQGRRVMCYVSLSRDPTRIGPRDAEIGFRLARTGWGQGYATEAVRKVLDAARGMEGTSRGVAIVDPNNLRSLHVLKKVGMIYEREIMFDGYDYPDYFYALQL